MNSCGLMRTYAVSIFEVSAGRPLRMVSCPCSDSSVGANVTSPSPMRTSAVMPAGDSATNAAPDGILSVRSGAVIVKSRSVNCLLRSSVSRSRPSMAATSEMPVSSQRVGRRVIRLGRNLPGGDAALAAVTDEDLGEDLEAGARRLADALADRGGGDRAPGKQRGGEGDVVFGEPARGEGPDAVEASGLKGGLEIGEQPHHAVGLGWPHLRRLRHHRELQREGDENGRDSRHSPPNRRAVSSGRDEWWDEKRSVRGSGSGFRFGVRRSGFWFQVPVPGSGSRFRFQVPVPGSGSRFRF